jgi:hypothetical protein
MMYTVFAGHRRLATGPLATITGMVAEAQANGSEQEPLLVFDDRTGRVVDVDLRGTSTAVDAPPGDVPPEASAAPPRSPGRPRLGVVAREVTLLPHHWEWLAAQPGGASVTLRKLVELARKQGAGDERIRLAREATYRFLHAIGGNLPDYEEVTRALFAGQVSAMRQHMHEWPHDVRAHALAMLESLSATDR